MTTRTLAFLRLVALLLLGSGVNVFASGLPDTEVNPQSGNCETVQSFLDSQDYNIRHLIDPGEGEPQEVTVLTSHATDDLDPRISITSDGDSWVAWWRDASTDGVYYRYYDYSAETWSSEARISESDESSREPEIIDDGTDVWVAYEYDSGSSTAVAVSGGVDDPEPFPGRTTIATTSFTGDVDTKIHYESSQLWVTWVHGSSDVGWSEYDSSTESWSSPDYESYANDSVEEARSRIRTAVLE